jgi:hypothetical protein
MNHCIRSFTGILCLPMECEFGGTNTAVITSLVCSERFGSDSLNFRAMCSMCVSINTSLQILIALGTTIVQLSDFSRDASRL